jgi:hypothetical protein
MDNPPSLFWLHFTFLSKEYTVGFFSRFGTLFSDFGRADVGNAYKIGNAYKKGRGL